VADKVIISEDAAVKFPDLALESPTGGALRLPLVVAPAKDTSPETGSTGVPDASLLCLSFRASSQV
jgi:ATPase complex subunit ATP10